MFEHLSPGLDSGVSLRLFRTTASIVCELESDLLDTATQRRIAEMM